MALSQTSVVRLLINNNYDFVFHFKFCCKIFITLYIYEFVDCLGIRADVISFDRIVSFLSFNGTPNDMTHFVALFIVRANIIIEKKK